MHENRIKSKTGSYFRNFDRSEMNTSILHHKIRRLKAYLREVTDIAIAYKYIFHNNILKSYLLFAIAKAKHKLKKIKDERKFKI